MPEGWHEYIAGYHDANPGITEDLLAGAHDGAGRSPYDWLVEAVPAGAGTVVDLACGSGPVGRRLAGAAGVRVVGVDRSAGELARAGGLRARAEAAALPLAGGCAGAVAASMALMLLSPLEAVLAEVARVLAPGATFVATVPSRATTAATPAFTAVLRALGQAGVGYPEPLQARVAERFGAAGLTLAADDSQVFSRPVTSAAGAALVVRSFYAPGAGAGQVAAAISTLEEAMPVTIDYRIRRLVARRSAAHATAGRRVVAG